MRERAGVFLVALIIMSSYRSSDSSNDGVERTLAMIKPDGVRANHTVAIKQIIATEGFKVVAEKEALFDEAAAQSFYKEHSERNFFPQLVQFMTSGPVLALVLERQNAIKGWRALMGPTDSNKARLEAPNSLRAKFGLDGQSNCVHGSDSPEAATREIEHFFDVIPPACQSTLQNKETFEQIGCTLFKVIDCLHGSLNNLTCMFSTAAEQKAKILAHDEL